MGASLHDGFDLSCPLGLKMRDIRMLITLFVLFGTLVPLADSLEQSAADELVSEMKGSWRQQPLRSQNQAEASQQNKDISKELKRETHMFRSAPDEVLTETTLGAPRDSDEAEDEAEADAGTEAATALLASLPATDLLAQELQTAAPRKHKAARAKE